MFTDRRRYRALAINWFERAQMFAFRLGPMLTSPLSVPPLAVQIIIDRGSCCQIHPARSEHPDLATSSGWTRECQGQRSVFLHGRCIKYS